jgi:Protein of unknown function (DUF4240)
MDIDRFWQLIDQARTAAGPQADQATRDFDLRDDGDPDRDYWDFDDDDMQALVESARAEFATSSGEADESDDDVADLEDDEEEDEDEDDITDPVAVALYELLTQLPAAEIAGFDNTFEDVRARAGEATMANAAVLIEHGFLGDDSFDDFRAGLVALGRTTFETAVANPDTLADHPMVREIAAANDPRWLGREDMLFVASHAYAAVTGEDEITFYDYAESMRDPAAEAADSGEEEPEWPITDEHEARRRLPRLSDLFYERSMRNRKRALDKLGLQA